MRDFRAVVLAVLVFLGFLGLARAFGASGQNGVPPGTTNIFASGYYLDEQTVQPYTGAIAAADTTTLSSTNLSTLWTIANKRRIATNGRPNLPLSVRFTGGSGATVAVRFAALYTDKGGTSHLLGISDVTTITATAFTDPDGRNIGTTLLSDSYGSNEGIWLVDQAPSSGSVYFDPGSY